MRWIFFSLLAANIVLLGWLLLFQADSVHTIPRQDAPDVAHSREGGPSIRLLRDVNQAELGGTASTAPQARPKAEAVQAQTHELPPAQQMCTFVGPFEAMPEAEALVERLQAMDVEGEVVKVDIPAGPGYWVHLPPLDSRRAALRRLADLQALGVDSYIIPRGELMNGISLGMFSKEPLAKARMAELRDMGIDARLNVIDRSYQEIWVSVPAQSAQYLSDQAWQRLLQSKKNAERKQNSCLAVASGHNFH
jgi:hypothetical protein